jgi:branched-chain amino acid transport system substrate-binding protein
MKNVASVSANRLRTVWVAALVAASCLVSGCSGELSATPTVLNSAPTPPATTGKPEAAQAVGEQTPAQAGGNVFSGDTIKIGVDMPTSAHGAPQPDVIALRDAVQLAIDQANSAGGVVIAGKTYKLEMYALDNQDDYKIGQRNAEAFVADPAVLAVVGPTQSAIAPGDMPIFNEAGLAQISPTNTRPNLTKPQYGMVRDLRPTGKLTYFRVVTTDDTQGPAGADYMYDKLRVRKIYILDDLSDYARMLDDNVARRFREDGGTVLGRENLAPDAQNYAAILKKVADTKPDALYYAGVLDPKRDQIRKQMVAMGVNIPFVGSDGIIDPQYIQDAGSAAEGTYATTVVVNPAALAGGRRFLADYKARFGKELTILDHSAYAPAAYDAANVIIAAMKRAQSPDRESVRQQIAATRDYPGILGTTSFDENGDTTVHWISVFKVVNGEWIWADQFNYQGTLP